MDGCRCHQHSRSIGGTESLYTENNGGEVSRMGPLAQKIEDISRLYLRQGPSESIKDHGNHGPGRFWP